MNEPDAELEPGGAKVWPDPEPKEGWPHDPLPDPEDGEAGESKANDGTPGAWED